MSSVSLLALDERATGKPGPVTEQMLRSDPYLGQPMHGHPSRRPRLP